MSMRVSEAIGAKELLEMGHTYSEEIAAFGIEQGDDAK
jgi:hypothetical protein